MAAVTVFFLTEEELSRIKWPFQERKVGTVSTSVGTNEKEVTHSML